MTTQATIPGLPRPPALSVRRTIPARVPEMLEALQKVTPAARTGRDGVRVAGHARTEIFAESGAVVFREGDPATKMTILLQGEIYVRREHGGPAALFIGRSGQITGLLPFSRMKAYGGLGYTSAPTWGLEFDRSLFPEMLKAIPSMAERWWASFWIACAK